MPEKLAELQAIYSTHLRGEKIDLEAVEARLGRPLANDQQDYTVQEGGIAVLSLSGAISPKANMLTRVSGMASAQMFTKQIQSMAADPRVRGVVLDIDSPGGSVFGIPEAGAAVRALAAEKPTVACSTGMMCSAAYWIGSSAGSLYASGETDMIGSIGVVATHSYDPRNTSGQVTEVTAGKYKRIASDTAPLSDEGRAYLQQQVDHLYSAFVDAVAKNRRASAEDVIKHMADGRVFIGTQAVDAGLVDGIATVDALVERMANDPQKFAARRKAVFAVGSAQASAGVAEAEAQPVIESGPVLPEASTKPNEVHMDPKELAAKFAAESPEAAALLRAEGASAELDRVKAVKAAALPGHEALVEQLAMDGKTTGADAALQVIAAERGKTAVAAEARKAEAPAPVQTAALPAESKPADANASQSYRAGERSFAVDADSAKLDAKVRAYMAEHPGSDYIKALAAVTQEA